MVNGELDTTHTVIVTQQVIDERRRQVEKGFTLVHDDEHTPADFALFIRERLLRAELHPEPILTREQFVQVAALAVACVESLDRRFAVE